MGYQLADNPLRRADWYRKADAMGHEYHGRIDPDHPAPAVYQGTSGVSRIEGNVGLYDILYQPAGLVPQRPPEGGDNAG
jgi:hypothetical protein